MTREEQIKQAAEKSSEHISDWVWNFAYRAHFIAGAEWADAHPVSADGEALLYAVNSTTERTEREVIAKACGWLERELKEYITVHPYSTFPSIDMEELLDDLKKAIL